MAGFPYLGLLRELRQPIEHRGHIPLASQMGLPRFTCRTQTYWLGCRSQSLPLLSASRCRRLGLATRSPRNPVRRHTCTTDIRRRDPYVCPASVRMPPDKPCRWRRHFSPQTRINRFVFLNLPILSLEAHLGVTTSPHAPFPTGYVTLPMYGRSPPLRLVLSRSR